MEEAEGDHRTASGRLPAECIRTYDTKNQKQLLQLQLLKHIVGSYCCSATCSLEDWASLLFCGIAVLCDAIRVPVVFSSLFPVVGEGNDRIPCK